MITRAACLGENPNFSTEAVYLPHNYDSNWAILKLKFNQIGRIGNQMEKHSIYNLKLLFPLNIFSRYLKKSWHKYSRCLVRMDTAKFEPIIKPFFANFPDYLLFSQCFPRDFA